MADQAWLKHLAEARYSQHGLLSNDPESVQRLANIRLDETLQQLFAEAQEACAIFNRFASEPRATQQKSKQRSMHVMRLLSRADGGQLETAESGGLLLSLGRVQISLERRGSNLIAQLTAVQVYDRRTRPLHQFSPQADQFGSLIWRMDNNTLLMHPELIIKRLMEDLLRAACENGDA